MSAWDRAMLVLDGSRLWWVLVGFQVGLIFAVVLQEMGVPL